MKISLCLIFLLNISCSPMIFSKKRYDKAVEWLTYTNPRYQIQRMSRNKLEERLPIIYTSGSGLLKTDKKFNKGDTVLLKADKNTFIFKNTRTRKIFVFHFFDDAWATTIEFDRYWNIVEYHGIRGEDY